MNRFNWLPFPTDSSSGSMCVVVIEQHFLEERKTQNL